MKNFLLRLVAIALLAGFFHACNETLVEEPTANDLELKSAQKGLQGYIVVLNDAELDAELSNLKGYEKRKDAAQNAASKVLKRAGIVDGQIGHAYGTAIKGFSVKIPPGQLKKLENDASVIRVEKDKIISLIKPFAKPGDGEIQATAAQETPWGITRVNGGADGIGKTAWIIDSGIDLDHPDLNVDATRGRVFVRAKSPDDDNGHGTHVAGTIAALNNSEGVVGVAAGATVVPVKVLDRRGSGSLSGVIAGIDYVAANAGSDDVANMSLGGGISTTLDQAVIDASATCKFVLAAGNESDDADNHSPARANGPNIFTISASDSNDNWAYFSNYGNPPVDYCAPGVSVLSTYKNGGYATLSGTSMAAPHVAGILLIGNIKTDGTVSGDPDGNADPIATYGGTVTNPTNYPPVANAGSEQQLTDTDNNGSESVQLDGSGSTDDNGITSYSWSENGSIIATGVTPVVDLGVGTHTITLTVSDGEFTDTDEVVVTINPGSSTNEAPAISSFNLSNASNPAWTKTSVNWAVTDNDGNLQSVQLELFDSAGNSVDSANIAVSGSSASGITDLGVKGGPSGEYKVELIVTDAAGNSTTGQATINL